MIIDMPLLDTTQYKDSFGTFIADLVLQILSWVAQEEGDHIRKRQHKGMDAAIKNGVFFGRPKAKISHEFIESYKRWKTKEITAVQAMKEAKVIKR
ncbi:recombinase family protein [Priestia endophytica]|uniref:recombinase family protein n=1 Tax=Priestia endophytica TaxID=135735 RepID=UPI0026B6BFD7|nr:recombinase family protein [Priestia endophytica]